MNSGAMTAAHRSYHSAPWLQWATIQFGGRSPIQRGGQTRARIPRHLLSSGSYSHSRAIEAIKKAATKTATTAMVIKTTV